MQRIESLSNAKIKRLKSLNRKKVRDQLDLFLVEGKKMTQEAILSPFDVVEIFISDSFHEKNETFIQDIEKIGIDLYVVKDYIIDSVTATVNTQGILTVIRKHTFKLDDALHEGGSFLLLDNISDPGNLGTIIRTAEAFGMTACFYTQGTVDIYNDKVLRSTMGAVYRMPYIEISSQYIDLLKEMGYQFIAMSLQGAILDPDELSRKSVVVIGNEANGVSEAIYDICDKKVKIEMTGDAESLNAAVAAAIIMYELSKT